MENKINRYEKVFTSGKKAFIPFTVIGDPNYDTSLDVVRAFVDGGADVLELGFPFSDPLADGPVNQKAGIRSLKAGMNTDKMFQFIKDVRKFTDIPIGLLCYYNSVLQYGIDNFYKASAISEIDSILVADSAIEEASPLIAASKKTGVSTVFIISELSNDSRIKKTAKETSGFIYLVARLGVTGTDNSLDKNIDKLIKKVKRVSKKPVCIGFGISKPSHVVSLSKTDIDGIICGSAIVQQIEDNLKNKNKMLKDIKEFVKSMKGSIK